MKRVFTIILILLLVVGAVVGFMNWSAMRGQPSSALETKHMSDDDRIITVSGANIRIREQGAGNAPPIILLHGFTGSLETWDHWALDLARDYRVIRYDLLGHGLTGPDTELRYSPLERADFLIEVMDALGVDKAVVGGNSLGGLIAWRAASNAPGRFDKLLLVDPALFDFSGVEDAPAEPDPNLAAALRLAPMPAIKMIAAVNFADPSKITEERLVLMQDMMQRTGNGQAFIDHISEFTMPDSTEELSQLDVPTLILWGEKDALIPSEQGVRAVEVMPDAQLEIIEGAGHLLQEDAPEASLAKVRAYLQAGAL